MTEHLTMEQLLALRQPGVEPGVADARAHVAGCERCRDELMRLDQRIARLRALPALRPARDRWPRVQVELDAVRQRQRLRWIGLGAVAIAASVAMLLLSGAPAGPQDARAASAEISAAQARSRELEAALRAYNPDARILDGGTARVVAELEDRIAGLDRALEAADLLRDRERDEALVRLWRERVGLMDALVDVHVTQATAVEF